MSNVSTEVEARLIREVEEIDRRIRELTSEKLVIQRLLVRVRQGAGEHEVGRRNSGERILIETKLRDELRNANRPLTSSALYLAARSVSPNLKQSTFRSHLHRMKNKRMIRNSSGRPGIWQLGDSEIAPATEDEEMS